MGDASPHRHGSDECLGRIVQRPYDGSMEYSVRRFKSLTIALQELAPFIRSGQHLTGPAFAQFGELRSREMLVNWLLCAVADTFTFEHNFAFTTDPQGGDGVIVDELTGETWLTEHVIAYPGPAQPTPADGNAFILKMIMHKHDRGEAYANGKTLAVLVESIGIWNPTALARMLPDPLLFDAVWVVGLHAADAAGYHYDVTRLDLTRGVAPVWRVDWCRTLHAGPSPRWADSTADGPMEILTLEISGSRRRHALAA